MSQPQPTARGRRRPSLATVIASVALFVALGGTGYAAIGVARNSVGTAALQNGAVTGAKLAGAAVTPSKIQVGAGVKLVYTRATTNLTVAAGADSGQYVTCPKGTYPVSGGLGDNNATDLFVTESLPYNSVAQSYSGIGDSWVVYVQNTGTQSQVIDVYAECLAAASASSTY